MTEQLDLFAISEPEEEKSEKREQKSSITPRQWALYRLIYHNSLIERRKTTQKEICEKLSDYGYVYTESNNTSDHCSMIWTDVNANNMSLEHDKIIITEKYVYWIGNERETKKFLAKLWRDLSPRLQRYWFFVYKVGFDGLGKLFDKNLNEIDYDEDDKDIKNTRRIFHECFNEYDIELQKANKELEEEEKRVEEDVEELR